MTGQEERDMLLARLFGITALAQSRLLMRDELSSEADLARAIEILEGLAAKKSWLREGAAWATARIFEALHFSEVTWREKAAKHLIGKIVENERDWSQEKVALILLARKWFPDLKWKKLLAPTFKDSNILSSSNLQTLSRVTKVSC
jgi:DNA polymerase phi